MNGGKYVSTVSTLIIFANMPFNNMFIQLMNGGKYVSTVSTLIIVENKLSNNMFLQIMTEVR